MSDLWLEKYRPKTLDDIVGNAPVVDRLRAIADLPSSMPHLILSGPPGCGKTSSVHALARQILGPAASDAVLELNASDDRGIDVVRGRIKQFAKERVSVPDGLYKIIILDEADAMTTAAQQALRRIIELHAATTRFALACNTSSKLIEPLQSRCAILRFIRVDDASMMHRMKQICTLEKVDYTADGMEQLVFSAEGDMRNALNNLQSVHLGQGQVNRESVLRVCDQPSPLTIKQALAHCLRGDSASASDEVDTLLNLGYSAMDVLSSVLRVLRNDETIHETIRVNWLRELALAHVRFAEGVASRVQFDAVLCRLAAHARAGPDAAI